MTGKTKNPNETAVPRRGCWYYAKRGLLRVGVVLAVLIILGIAYQTIATEQDKGKYAPRGQLYNVNGHQMHMICMGKGSPTVILQAGGLAESTWWYWVQNQLAAFTRVCAFDRPGFGWSEAVDDPRDALTINAELHSLLQQAGIAPPYVMAGHSLGAMWTRVYAKQYPPEIIGIVLVDSAATPASEPFPSQSAFEEWKTPRILGQAVVWVAYRIGVERLTAPTSFQGVGYPADLALEMATLQSPNRVFDASYAEQIPGMWGTINATAAVQDLGALPTIILWAGSSTDMQVVRVALRKELSALSSNSVTRFIEGADHGSILGTEQYAQQVTNAILDVIAAAQTGKSLSE
ncbi:MAG: alpha/beta hydrolase [Anaerolineae bacterium]|nr:alpha/beta hydrolase [Anaerolineae bacterium]